MSGSAGGDRDFRLYWIGLAINSLGSQVSLLALPLIAVVLLNADATQMGVLTAIGYVPFILVGLQAGVWADRMPRRPLLIWSNLLSAGLLLTIPLAAVLGVLRIEQLYVLALLIGATLLKLMPEKLRFVNEYRLLIFGLLLVVMMRFRPEGLIANQRRQLEFHEEDEELAERIDEEIQQTGAMKEAT